MTPSWLEAHASFIDSSRTATAEQLTFNGGVSRHAALLKVPLIPAGFFKVNTPLTVEITVANDVTIGTTVDSDISFGVSDGTRFIGFDTCDMGNYGTNAPCYKMEGLSGTTISSKKVGPYTTKPSQNFYPGQFLFTINLNESWGACYTARDGGFRMTTAYSNCMVDDQQRTKLWKSTKKTNQKSLESDSLKSPSRKMMFKTESRKPPCNSLVP